MTPEQLAHAYYTQLSQKKLEGVEKYIHSQIEFKDPQEKILGKEAFLKAAKRFSAMFESLTILEKFGSGDQAVIIYEVKIPHLEKPLKAVSWLNFQEGLISKIELIYDRQGLFEPQETQAS